MSVKSDVIRFLEENRGRAVSGQQLAESLGVSRAAVWKAVKALEAEGYAVEATRNKGYRLAPQADEISAEGVRVYLPASWRDYPVEVTAETESTNLRAPVFPRRAASDCPGGGQRPDRWTGAAGKGLLLAGRRGGVYELGHPGERPFGRLSACDRGRRGGRRPGSGAA